MNSSYCFDDMMSIHYYYFIDILNFINHMVIVVVVYNADRIVVEETMSTGTEMTTINLRYMWYDTVDIKNSLQSTLQNVCAHHGPSRGCNSTAYTLTTKKYKVKKYTKNGEIYDKGNEWDGKLKTLFDEYNNAN